MAVVKIESTCNKFVNLTGIVTRPQWRILLIGSRSGQETPKRLHAQGWAPYPSDRAPVWWEVYGPAGVRSNLAAVGSMDRLVSVERLPLRTLLWEGDRCKVNLWGFSRNQQHLPASHSPWLYRFCFCALKQKYRTLHPGGNKQANVQYCGVKKQAIVNFFGRLWDSFNCKLIRARVFCLAKIAPGTIFKFFKLEKCL